MIYDMTSTQFSFLLFFPLDLLKSIFRASDIRLFESRFFMIKKGWQYVETCYFLFSSIQLATTIFLWPFLSLLVLEIYSFVFVTHTDGYKLPTKKKIELVVGNDYSVQRN